MQNNENKIALVSGANTGVGFQIAKALVENGYTVYAGSRNLQKGKAAAEQLGESAIAIQLDITDNDSVATAVKTIGDKTGYLTLLVNNAAVSHAGAAGRTMDSHDTFPQRVWQIVASIPEGYVATYGDVAQLAGSPRAARQVGGVLKRLPEGSQRPWHRVVNRHGDISLTGPDLQRQRQALLAEGVQVSGSGHIDLQHYRWIY